MTSRDLYELQRPDGGFESAVTSRRGRLVDCNGFTAAMVLRLTRHVPDDAVMTIVRQRALRFVTTCVSSTVPDAFAFWPDGARPEWAASMPADVDDTAIMLSELVRHGWIARADALGRFCRAILPHRVREVDAAMLPPWVRTGSFYTWIAETNTGAWRGSNVNIVDCCVNANVAALMSLLGAEHLPGFEAAVLTVVNGVGWAGRDRRRLPAVTPFYPSVQGLIDAVEYAVESGVHALCETRDRLRAFDLDLVDGDQGCCSSAYGSTVWQCTAIDTARALAGAAGRAPATTLPAVQAAAG